MPTVVRLTHVLKSLFSRFRKPQEHVDAIDRAREYFVDKHGKQDHRSWARVIAEIDGTYIVRLCYGHTKPPGRVYFRVDGGGDVDELEFSQVRQYGERPWR